MNSFQKPVHTVLFLSSGHCVVICEYCLLLLNLCVKSVDSVYCVQLSDYLISEYCLIYTGFGYCQLLCWFLSTVMDSYLLCAEYCLLCAGF